MNDNRTLQYSDEEISSAILLNSYDLNSTLEWLDSIFEQIAGLKSTNERSLIVEVDLKKKSSNVDTEFLLENIKSYINESFHLLPKNIINTFIALYAFVIFMGLFNNLFMICAYFKSGKTNKLRNIFVVNLAFR
jgi:hypothetical protein